MLGPDRAKLRALDSAIRRTIFTTELLHMTFDNFSRRGFLQSSAVAITAGTVLSGTGSLMAQPLALSLTAVDDGLKAIEARLKVL